MKSTVLPLDQGKKTWKLIMIFHVYDPDWVDDQLSHDESVGKYVMMNSVYELLPANPAGP